MNIKTNLAAASNHGGTRSTSLIKWIVIHYTSNDGDTDEANANYFKTGGRGASAHYFVDDKGNWYMTNIFRDWCEANNFDIPVWDNN